MEHGDIHIPLSFYMSVTVLYLMQKSDIELAKPGIVKLAADLAGIKEAVDEFTKVKNSLITEEHLTIFRDKKGEEHKYIKKSGWRMIALAFNISDRVVGKEIKDLSNGEYAITYTVEAIAPNGRISQETGTCTTIEKAFIDKEQKTPNKRKIHDADSHALTRAKNRAISGLVGLGEVSAEEVDLSEDQTVASNFCKDATHKHTPEEEKNNKCSKTGKFLRMPN